MNVFSLLIFTVAALASAWTFWTAIPCALPMIRDLREQARLGKQVPLHFHENAGSSRLGASARRLAFTAPAPVGPCKALDAPPPSFLPRRYGRPTCKPHHEFSRGQQSRLDMDGTK